MCGKIKQIAFECLVENWLLWKDHHNNHKNHFSYQSAHWSPQCWREKEMFCIKKQLINTMSWTHLQFCQHWAYESQGVGEVKKDSQTFLFYHCCSSEASFHQKEQFGMTVIEFLPFQIESNISMSKSRWKPSVAMLEKYVLFVLFYLHKWRLDVK